MDSKYHVAFFVGQDGIWVCYCIVKEPSDEKYSVFGGFGLDWG